MRKLTKILIAINVILWGLIFVAAITDYGPEGQTQQSWLDQLTGKPIKQIRVNVCVYSKHPEYWENNELPISEEPKPGSLPVGSIPACEDVIVDVLEIRKVCGTTYYKIKYNNLVGWQTEYMLTGKNYPYN